MPSNYWLCAFKADQYQLKPAIFGTFCQKMYIRKFDFWLNKCLLKMLYTLECLKIINTYNNSCETILRMLTLR